MNMAVIAPRAGELKPFGDELVQGAKIAVDEVNSQGGVNGERINLVVVDDQCDDLLAVSTAQMMAVNSSLEDKINVVIGPFCHNSFGAVSDIYANAKVFQIIPTAVNSENALNKNKGLVMLVGGQERQSQDVFAFYEQNFADERLALVYDSGMRDVVDIAAALQNEFRSRGLSKNLGTFNFADYDGEYGEMADEIIGMDAGIAYILGNAEDIEALSRRLKRKNRNFVILTNRYLAGPDYAENLGSLAEGNYFVALPSLKDNPAFTETLVKIRLLGKEPEGLGVYSYSAVKLWQDIAVRNKSFQYNKLSKSLENDYYSTLWGEMVHYPRENEQNLNYGIYRIMKDGEYTQVY